MNYIKIGTIPKATRPMFMAGFSIVLVVSFIGIFAPFLPLHPYRMSEDNRLMPPSSEFLMGTDHLGRDIFSRILYGSRYSVSIAVLAVSLAFIIGMPVGSVSAYIGGKLDRGLVAFMDILYAFPAIVLAIVIVITLGSGAINTCIAIAIPEIAGYFRVARSVTLSIKERGFIEAQRAIGAGDAHVLFHHILPYTIPSIAVLMTLGIGTAIISVAGLGFLGLGVPAPVPEWGTDLSIGRGSLTSGIWWPSTFPGIMIFVTVIGFNLLGEALVEVVNPPRVR